MPSEKAASSCASAQAVYLTDEVRDIIVDELNSIENLDPLIKHQFLVDLKVLPDKDMYYWRYRLLCLQNSSNSDAPTCQELKSLAQTVSDLEKVVEQNSIRLTSVESVQKTPKERTKKNLPASISEQKLSDGDKNLVAHTSLKPSNKAKDESGKKKNPEDTIQKVTDQNS